MAVELFLNSTATGSRSGSRMAVEFQCGSRKKSGSRNADALPNWPENNNSILEYNDIHTHALETIARCLSNDEILNQFHDSGALAKLILAIKTSLETHAGEECGIYFSDFIFEMNKSHKELS